MTLAATQCAHARTPNDLEDYPRLRAHKTSNRLLQQNRPTPDMRRSIVRTIACRRHSRFSSQDFGQCNPSIVTLWHIPQVARARRHLLACNQQCAQPGYTVWRLLAHLHGEPLCQCRADRTAQGGFRLLQHGDYPAGEAVESVRLRSCNREPCRSRCARLSRSGGGNCRVAATHVWHQARSPQVHAARASSPPA